MKNPLIDELFIQIRHFIEFGAHKRPQKDNKRYSDAENELKQKLSPELLDLHTECVNAAIDDMADEVHFYFAEGFKTGLLLGIECAEQ